MGFRNPFTVATDPKRPGRWWSASTARTRATNSTTRGPAGDHRVEPRHQARLLRLAAVRGRQLGRQLLLPVHVPERPVRRPVRLLGGGDPQRVAEQHRPAGHPRPGRRRGRLAQAHRRPSRALRDPDPLEPQESITGPVYDYDAANPSDTKWPAYYDGAWLILDRAQNWWRETRIKDDGSGMLRVNGLFGTSQFGTPNHTYPMPVKFGPDGSLYLATWGLDCCRAQLPTSQPGRLMRIDFIGDQVDTTAPVVEATVEGPRNGAGEYLGRATLSLTATDSSGIARVEYSPTAARTGPRYDAPVGVHHARDLHGSATAPPTARGQHLGDPAGRRSASSRARVRARAVGRVRRHAGHVALELPPPDDAHRRAGTERRPTAACSCRSAHFSLDLARTGPAAILAQPLPDGRLHVVTKITAPGLNTDTGGSGQHLRAGRPEALPDQRQLDQGLALAQRRRQPDGRDEHLLRARLRDQRDAHARHAHRPAAPATCRPGGCAMVRTGATLAAAYSLSDPEGAARELGRARHGQHRHGDAGGVRPALHRRLRRQRVDDGELRLPALHAGLGGRPRGARELAHAPRRRRRRRLVPHAGRRHAQRGRRRRVRLGHRAHRVPRRRRDVRAYSAPVRVAADGEHAFEYRSLDKAGNVERRSRPRSSSTPPRRSRPPKPRAPARSR